MVFALSLEKKLNHRDLLLALVIGAVAVTNTIPVNYIGIVVGLSIACIFGACRDIFREQQCSFVWVRTDIKSNLIILGSISLFYVFIFFTQPRGTFGFYPIFILTAWAPALSEELIFRVFLPAMIFRLFKLEDNIGNRVWVFIILTIPFALLHCTELLAANEVSETIRRCYTVAVNTLVHAILVRKCGFFYGAYAHALTDFLAFSLN